MVARKHHSPSETTVADGAKWLAANTATSCSVCGCWRKQANTGWPCGVVCTAATKVPLPTEAQLAELDRRIADHDANPDDVVPWSEVKAEVLARIRRWR